MKTKLKLLLPLLSLCILHSTFSTAHAQGTAFTYQGQLRSNGVPLNGNYDFAFTLSNAPSGGSQVGSPVTNLAVGVTNGLFTTTLDFGAIFAGNATWLAIGVRSNNVGSYTPMTPLQELTPTPYAIFTPNAGSAGMASNVVSGIDITNAVVTSSIFSGNGGGLTGLNASQLSSGVVSTSVLPGFQENTGFATVGGGYENQSTSTSSTVGGGFENIANGQVSTVGGGQNNLASDTGSTVGGGQFNTNNAYFGTISGGWSNNLGSSANYSTVGGGDGNTATSYEATVGGGGGNSSDDDGMVGGGHGNTSGFFAAVAGGGGNQANNYGAVAGGSGNTANNYGAVAGGSVNTANGWAAVGGGSGNQAVSSYATVGGGNQNIANGQVSTIGGGEDNSAGNTDATVGGGGNNSAAGYSSVVGGGQLNTNSASWGTLGGGFSNNISSTGNYSTLGGGYNNKATNLFATVPGGSNNIAGGKYSFAAGQQAQALHQGAFVWADSSNAVFASTTSNQFSVRANGGARFVTSGAGLTLDGNVVLTNNESGITLGGTFSGNGGGLTSLSAAQLTSINSQNNNPAGNDYANFFIGSAGNATTSGSYNIAIGFLALDFNTTGSGNTADGVYSLEQNTIGSDNTAYGLETLSFNTTGSNNTAYGVFALQGNTIGNNNTAIGFNTLGDFDAMNGTSGSNNIALGYAAGAAYNAHESSNIDIGYVGSLGENYTTHIGTSGVQTTAYIAGVITGNGGGLTSLNAANLTGAGTLPDAVLPGNVALLNGNQIFTNVDTFSNGLTVATTAGTLAVIADQNAVPGITATGGLAVGHMRMRNAVEVWPNATQTSGGYLDVRNTANNATISLTGSSGAIVCSNVTANGVVLTSDRNAKQNFTPLDPEAALAKVSAMPVTEWNYKSDPAGTKHIGPMAQDFHAAFGLNGGDDTHISVVDEGGVALAAIQGLNQKLNEKDAEIKKLKEKADKVDSLEKQLNDLAATVKLLAERK